MTIFNAETGWLTIFVSPYITWQGYLYEVPEIYSKHFTITINP